MLTQTRELGQGKEEAEAATRSREDFIAVVSYEIRNPLNGFLGVAQLLKDTPLNSERQTLLDVMNISAEGLLSILNDVFGFSKMQAGTLELPPIPSVYGCYAMIVAHCFRRGSVPWIGA